MTINKFDQSTKPTIQKVISKNVPKELKKINQWTLWRYIWKGGKWTKPPVDPDGNVWDHHKAKLTFKEALKAHKKNPELGIGISMRRDDQICGIDIDPGPDGKIPKKLIKAIKTCGSYSEISPSGAGYRIFGVGTVPTHGAKKGSYIESYCHGRYLTVTGNANGSAGHPLTNIEHVAEWMIKQYSSSKKSKKKSEDSDQEKTPFLRSEIKQDDYEQMIKRISPNSYDDWITVGMALHHEYRASREGFRLWDRWSSISEKYPGEEELEDKWKGFGGYDGERCTGAKIRYLYEQIGGKVEYAERDIKAFQQDIFSKDKLIELPTNILPPQLREASKEVARYVKTSESLVITSFLGIFSAALSKKALIRERKDVILQPSLGFFQGIPTGGRKSGIDNILMKTFYKFERDEIRAWNDKRPKVEAMIKGYKDQIAFIRKGIRSGEVAMADAMDEIAEYERSIVEIDVPQPRIICSDITEEELSNLMDENDETMFISSDEGRNIIKNIVGRYSNGEAMSLYLCGLTGSPYKRSRVTSRKNINMDRPCLNVLVKIQKDALVDLVTNPAFIESGLAARLFLGIYNVEISDQYRIRGEKSLDHSKLQYFEDVLMAVLVECLGADKDGRRRRGYVDFELDEDVIDDYENFSHWYADQLDNGRWHGMEDITNKIVSKSVIMASILTVMWYPMKFIKKLQKAREDGAIQIIKINKQIYGMACKVVENMTDQSILVLKNADMEHSQADAIRIVRSIASDIMDKGLHGGKDGSFNGSVIQQKMSKNSRMEWKERLDVILSHYYFVEAPGGKYRLNSQILNGDYPL